jgi:hypothetical protein
MEVEKTQNPSTYILWYFIELIIKNWRIEFFFFETWQIWVMFSMKNPLYVSQNHIFQVQIWQNFTKETNAEVNTHFGMVKSLPIALGKAPGEPIRAS